MKRSLKALFIGILALFGFFTFYLNILDYLDKFLIVL